MSRPIHFEIQADDLERANAVLHRRLRLDLRGLRAVTGAPYWGVHTGDPGEPGINGGLMPRPAPAPGPGAGTNAAVLTMGVEDFDTTAATIEAAGGTVALPKTALTGMAWQGYFLDTEGNTSSASTSPTRTPPERELPGAGAQSPEVCLARPTTFGSGANTTSGSLSA